jgi:type IV pilus assembly protein PilW
MNRLQHPSTSLGRVQRGLTLVELMVAIAINLIIVIAAMSLYSGTRESQRTIDQATEANEVGVYALRTLGRDVINAGFYPSVGTEGNINVVQTYKVTAKALFAATSPYFTGIYGCEASAVNLTTGACGTAAAATDPDELVVGYFTSDAFGDMGGQRKDCNGNDVAAAAVNTTRIGTGPVDQPPAKPLFVANRYRLGPSTPVSIDGQSVNLRSLECQGNASTGFQSLIAGIDDFQVTYGVYADSSRVAKGYYTAAGVAALGAVTIDGNSIPAWGRVVAVRICVVSKTYGSNARLADKSGALRTWTKCDGTTADVTDGAIRKTYTQSFGLRNYLNRTY